MERYRVATGEALELARLDAADRSAFAGGKSEARKATRELNARLEALQELLWAESRHRLLVVLQAMDAGGKDGTIRHVFDGVNPQGVKVSAFKAPTPEELAHDYLWRIHRHTPARGEIVIFNRSHYEDVLVVRVKNLVAAPIWRRRYEQINAFEKMLTEEGTTLVKFFLHISADEQKRRLQSRLDRPHKRWKFNLQDLAERARWPDYMRAYEEALSRTSTPWAPWYVVPADRKWYRNWVISKVLVQTLEDFEMRYPEPRDPLDGIVVE